MSDYKDRLIAWLLSEKTGTSSKCIASHMMGVPDGWKSYPSDGGDFGRCLGLLAAVPEFKARLHEMAEVSSYWASLVAHWPQIEALHKEETDNPPQCGGWPLTYKLMRSILRPQEDKDPSIVRLSDTCTIRLGGTQ